MGVRFNPSVTPFHYPFTLIRAIKHAHKRRGLDVKSINTDQMRAQYTSENYERCTGRGSIWREHIYSMSLWPNS